jgi:hypothetical protein
MKKGLIISSQCLCSPKIPGGYGGSLYCLVESQKEYSLDFLYFGSRNEIGEKSISNLFQKIYHCDLSFSRKPIYKLVEFLKKTPRLLQGYKYNKFPSGLINNVYDFIVFDSFSSLPMKYVLSNNCPKNIAFLIDSNPLHYLRKSRQAGLISKI